MKPKILFIMHMPPPVHGASMVGKYIKDSERVNNAFECRYINMTLAQSLEDIGKGGMKKLLALREKLKEIRRAIREFQPDVVYVTPNSAGGAFYKDYVIVRTLQTSLLREASRRADGKLGQIVLHFHNKGVRTRQNRWLDDKLYRRYFKGVKVMLLAEGLYKDVEKYVKREDVMICPNGIPSPQDLKTPPTPLLRGERPPLIPLLRGTQDPSDSPEQGETEGVRLLYLSNMMAEKGVWTLLDACRIMKEKGVRFHCDFVGGWKDVTPEAFGTKMKEYGLEDVVTAHGPKYGAEKLPFFEKADVMVFPTYYHNECFPLVLLEGMMHGLACVSTEEGGIPAIIEDGVTGYIVKAKDPRMLASKISELANDRRMCLDMGTAGYKRFKENFTQEIFENRFVECITSVCK